jgi:hypothetical protein
MEASFQRAIKSLDQRRLYVVVQTVIMMNVILAEKLLYLRVQEFQSAVRLQHVECAICKYLPECHRYGEPSFVFDRYGKRVARRNVDAREYVGITVVERRQIYLHVCQFRLKNIYYYFRKRAVTEKPSDRRFLQHTWILFFPAISQPLSLATCCICQGRGRRRKTRTCTLRSTSIPYLTNNPNRRPRIVRTFY